MRVLTLKTQILQMTLNPMFCKPMLNYGNLKCRHLRLSMNDEKLLASALDANRLDGERYLTCIIIDSAYNRFYIFYVLRRVRLKYNQSVRKNLQKTFYNFVNPVFSSCFSKIFFTVDGKNKTESLLLFKSLNSNSSSVIMNLESWAIKSIQESYKRG